eukprot:3940594-Rhodomonas_salina.2
MRLPVLTSAMLLRLPVLTSAMLLPRPLQPPPPPPSEPDGINLKGLSRPLRYKLYWPSGQRPGLKSL